MNIENLTIAEARKIAALFNAAPIAISAANPECPGPWNVGKNYLIRTVTMIDCGKLIAVGEHELVLENASWIADTGRFADALKSLTFNEVEPFPDGKVILGRASIIDAIEINTVPRSQK